MNNDLRIRALENTLDMIQSDMNYEFNELRKELRTLRSETTRKEEATVTNARTTFGNSVCLCNLYRLFVGDVKRCKE